MSDREMKARETMLLGMNEIVMHLNNEDAMTPWLYGGVPDGADEEEIREMALDDDTFYCCTSCFLRIMSRKSAYEDGLYVGKKVITSDRDSVKAK